MAGTTEDLCRELAAGLPDADVQSPRPRRIFITTQGAGLRPAVQLLKDKGMHHVSTISSVDAGDDYWILYHFRLGGDEISVRAVVGKDNPEVPTITDLIPGAVYYEREFHDLMGVRPAGHPDLRRLVLPEDWPEGVYPLRKGWQPDGGGE